MPRLLLAILLYMHFGLVGFGSPHLIIDNEQTPKRSMLVQLRPPDIENPGRSILTFVHRGTLTVW
jgi:hypothetical protein